MRAAVVLFSVVYLLAAPVAAQEIRVEGALIEHARSNLNIVLDVIEFRQGDDALVHLMTGKKHYGLTIVSAQPIPPFDAELPASTPPPRSFTVKVEDGREFRGCLVTGLKSSGPDPSHNLAYALACENVTTPPLPCTQCPE